MSQTLSPYALLQASKPKPAPTITTAYDLYSAVQSAPPAANPAAAPNALSSLPPSSSVIPPEVPADQEQRPAAARMPLVPPKRTHYIADIKNRHNAALRRSASFPRPPMA